jgi:hypothetical protein
MDTECRSSNEEDQDLTANNDDLYTHKPEVAEHAFEDVESVI